MKILNTILVCFVAILSSMAEGESVEDIAKSDVKNTMISAEVEFPEVFYDALAASARKNKQTASEILQTYGIMFHEGSTAAFLPKRHTIRVKLIRSQLEVLQQFSDVTREYSAEQIVAHFEEIESSSCFENTDKKQNKSEQATPRKPSD